MEIKDFDKLLQRAKEGDIHAFQSLFEDIQDALRSYLYRLLASRPDAEDISHDTFIKAYDKVSQFRGDSSFKTWCFSIATNLAYRYLEKRKRWVPDVSEQAKQIVMSNPLLAKKIETTCQTNPHGRYEIKEHIDTCFTCISKNLPIENQVAIILKDIYDFSLSEIMLILDKTEGVVKYLLQNGRKTLTQIFDQRCALVNKNGVCHQCSELNGWLNPKQNQQEALMLVKMNKQSEKYNKEELYKLRTTLVKQINPLKTEGSALQELLLNCNRMAMKEIPLS